MYFKVYPSNQAEAGSVKRKGNRDAKYVLLGKEGELLQFVPVEKSFSRSAWLQQDGLANPLALFVS
jgi:hypothetical protein